MAQYGTIQHSITGGLDDIYTPRSFAQNSSGEIYSVGTFVGTFSLGGETITTNSANAVYVAKYGADLAVIWLKKITENEFVIQDTWTRFALDTDDNLLIGLSYTGVLYYNNDSSGTPATRGAVLVKLDPDANYIWTLELEGDIIGRRGVAVDSDNNIFVTGRLGNDMFISKFDSNGVLVWNNTGGGPNLDDQGYNVALDNSGNVFVAGMLSPSNSVYFNDIHVTFSITAQNPFFIAKYLANGTVQWVRYVYGTIWDKYVIISDMDCLSDGSIVAAGGYSQPLLMFSNGFSSVGPQMAGQDDFFLTRFSADGDRMWVNLSPPINGAEGGMVVSVENEVIHLLRNFEGTITNDVDTLTSYGNLDLLLEQYDPSGNLLSYTQYGGTNIDGATDLMVDNNSTYVIGMTQSPTVNVGTDSFSPDYPSSMYIIKLTQSPIGISPLEQAQLGTLYPNPNNGSFTISASGLVGDVRVTNVTGQVVYSGVANAFGKTEVQSPNVPSGVYVVHYEQGD